MSCTRGALPSFATTIILSDEMVRPSRRRPLAWILCRPLEIAAVFQDAVHRRPLQDFVLVPSMTISTPTTVLPLAAPTMDTTPTAGEGATRRTDAEDCANATEAAAAGPTKAPRTIQNRLNKAVTSQDGGPYSCPANGPSFGSPAIRLSAHLTRGFASPSHDGFAVSERVSADRGQRQAECQARNRIHGAEGTIYQLVVIRDFSCPAPSTPRNARLPCAPSEYGHRPPHAIRRSATSAPERLKPNSEHSMLTRSNPRVGKSKGLGALITVLTQSLHPLR
jgi:hypothetical protein